MVKYAYNSSSFPRLTFLDSFCIIFSMAHQLRVSETVQGYRQNTCHWLLKSRQDIRRCICPRGYSMPSWSFVQEASPFLGSGSVWFSKGAASGVRSVHTWHRYFQDNRQVGPTGRRVWQNIVSIRRFQASLSVVCTTCRSNRVKFPLIGMRHGLNRSPASCAPLAKPWLWTHSDLRREIYTDPLPFSSIVPFLQSEIAESALWLF
jgi:hypothetical protein